MPLRGRNWRLLLVLTVMSAAGSEAAVLLSDGFDSAGTSLPPGWFSAVAVGVGIPFEKDPNSGGYLVGRANSASEVHLYTPLLTMQGQYPLRIEFRFNTNAYTSLLLLEVSVNGGLYTNFETVGQWLPGEGPTWQISLTPSNPLYSGDANMMAFASTADFSESRLGGGEIQNGPVGATYQFRWRLGAIGGGAVGSPPASPAFIHEVTITTADPPSAVPEPTVGWSVGLVLLTAWWAKKRRLGCCK